VRAFTSGSKHSINFSCSLEEHQKLLSLQEMDLGVWEVKLAEEQACGLHPFIGQDLWAELEGLLPRVAEVEDE
jgi:hypothetical protein